MQSGVVTFTKLYSSTPDVLVGKYPTTIGTLSVEIVPPQKEPTPTGSSEKGDLVTPAGFDWTNNSRWGFYSRDDITIRIFGVSPLGPASHVDVLNANEALPLWHQVVNDWLTVLADGPTERFAIEAPELVWNSRSETGVPFQAGSNIQITKPRYITGEIWRYAFSRAGANARPPVSRTLLAGAKTALATQNWRAAVVDAATGAETALSSTFTAMGETAKMRPLGALIKLVQDSDVWLPADIHQNLVSLRNEVVHEGATVTGRQALRAVATANDLIDHHVPLPELADRRPSEPVNEFP